jgi:deazaflavin-dependent oxidoreductase (nitroreductase family)
MILIHHIGARSGRERVNPVTYLPDGNDMVITATKGGAPTNPDWYYNLKEHPRIMVEVGTGTFPVEASEVRGEERDELCAGLSRCGRVSPSTRPRRHASSPCSG